jgi:hypothetical protein
MTFDKIANPTFDKIAYPTFDKVANPAFSKCYAQIPSQSCTEVSFAQFCNYRLTLQNSKMN